MAESQANPARSHRWAQRTPLPASVEDTGLAAARSRQRRWQPKQTCGAGAHAVLAEDETGTVGDAPEDPAEPLRCKAAVGEAHAHAAPRRSADSRPPAAPLPQPQCVLECGGAEVVYLPGCLGPDDAQELFEQLLWHPSWQKRPIMRRDRDTGQRFEVLEGRPTISFSEPPGRRYMYSGSWREAEEFPDCALAAKARVEELLDPYLAPWARREGRPAVFNYCLANKYEHGGQAVGKHADDEPDILPRSPIATLSLGTERDFVLEEMSRPNRKGAQQPPSPEPQQFSVRLASGSVLLMLGRTQELFLHSISKDKRVRKPRISLTFRMNV